MSGRPLTNVASHILNTPLACTAAHAALLVAALRSQLNVDLLVDVEGNQLGAPEMNRMAAGGRQRADRRREERKLFDFQDGVAVIPVRDTLTKTWGLDPYSGFTGYDGIKTKHYAALEDDDVEAIAFIHDSPGGAVSGLFDLVDQIYFANKKNGGKLTYAIVDEQACSASYALASAADRVLVPRTGEVGSVGVIMLHSDYTKALDEDGIKVTVLRSGAHKAEGNPYEALKPDVAGRLQATLDDMRELFIDTVARNMGTTKKSVRETEALTYIGAAARDIGFANAVASADQAWMQLLDRRVR